MKIKKQTSYVEVENYLSKKSDVYLLVQEISYPPDVWIVKEEDLLGGTTYGIGWKERWHEKLRRTPEIGYDPMWHVEWWIKNAVPTQGFQSQVFPYETTSMTVRVGKGVVPGAVRQDVVVRVRQQGITLGPVTEVSSEGIE